MNYLQITGILKPITLHNCTKNIAVVAICRNEFDYIVEWVSYYKAIGIDSIYIYDNVSDDGTSELLIALDAEGLIRRIHWPRKARIPPQRDAYNHFIENFAQLHEYVLVCDIDEFLAFDDGYDLQLLLEEAEKKYGEVAAIAIPWLLFGSGGADKQTEGLVIERFQLCASKVDPVVKTIFNTRWTFNFRTHIADTVHGAYIDSAFRRFDADPSMPIRMIDPVPGKARMHHYYTKSREEWQRRSQLPKADRAGYVNRRTEQFEKHAVYTTQCDILARYAPKIKERIKTTHEAIAKRFGDLSHSKVHLQYVDADRIFGIISNLPPQTPKFLRLLTENNEEYIIPCHVLPNKKDLYFSFRRKWKNKTDIIRVTIFGSTVTHFFKLDEIDNSSSMHVALEQYNLCLSR